MVDYTTWMSIGLDECTSPGMSQNRRRQVFSDLADGWNRQKEQIKQMSKAEVRKNLDCP